MELLRRHLAPISEDAWEEIDEQAKISLKQFLSARKVVDIEGPKGWDLASVPNGRMKLDKNQELDVGYGIRQSLPLLEPRVRFTLKKWELDDIGRGAQDPELEPLEEAAKKIAFFEENILFNGLKNTGIEGLMQNENKPVKLTQNTSKWVDKVIEAVYKLNEQAIEGPYALILSPELWQGFSYLTECGCSKKEQLEKTIQGPVILSHYHDSGLLVSIRGGDFVLTLGSDYCIGYEDSNSEDVHLYLTESFTFQIFEPKAIIPLVK